MYRILKFLVIIYFAFSCKTLQKSTKKDILPIVDWQSILVETDTVYLITSQGDTLSQLENEVDISIMRYLPDSITIAAVGDIMTGTNYPNESYLPKDTGRYLWKEVKPILKQADITFGNLEGTILDSGGDQKTCSNPKLCYLFRSPEYLADNFKENGFDLMSLANNHANDFGEAGRINTQEVLDSLRIGHAGSIEQPYIIKRINHLNVGFCAFAPNRGTVTIHNYDRIKEIIQHLDSLSDLVIVSFHAGAEGAKNQHVTRKREFYYGEDRGNVYELAHMMIDNGADVILGHGPHIVRAVELYKERLISYSLGNFLTFRRFNLRNLAGQAPIIEIVTNYEGRFLNGRVHSFRQTYENGPRNDPNLSSLKTIQRLSLEDFPESPLKIEDDGRIIYIDRSKRTDD